MLPHKLKKKLDKLPLEIIFGLPLGIVIRILLDKFSYKNTLLTGPSSSGKTTFLQYISKKEIPNGSSSAPESYKVGTALFDEVTDFSGADAYLKAKFDEYIREHDYILFFFDVSEYINNTEYRVNSNARIDMIHRNVTSSQTVLLVGTHIDKASNNYKHDVELFFAGKPYQSRLNKIVYVNTTKKECVRTILNTLKE